MRRESTDIEDLFVGHINGMDNYARGLRAAARMIEDGTLDGMRAKRYAGFETSAIGKKFASGEATLEMMAAHAVAHGEPVQTSGKQETAESIFNTFAFKG